MLTEPTNIKICNQKRLYIIVLLFFIKKHNFVNLNRKLSISSDIVMFCSLVLVCKYVFGKCNVSVNYCTPCFPLHIKIICTYVYCSHTGIGGLFSELGERSLALHSH